MDTDNAEKQDYYEVLQVSPNAEPEVIKAAYKKLALKYHPDTSGGNDPARTEKMANLNRAYETLIDSNKRRDYDERRKKAYSSVKPIPVASPDFIQIRDLKRGETGYAVFQLINRGGPFINLRIDPFISNWLRIINMDSIRTHLLPLDIQIEVTALDLDWGKTYRETINIWLDNQKTSVTIELKTASQLFHSQSAPEPPPRPEAAVLAERQVELSYFKKIFLPGLWVFLSAVGLLDPENIGKTLAVLAALYLAVKAARYIWKEEGDIGATIFAFLGAGGLLELIRWAFFSTNLTLGVIYGGGLFTISAGRFLASLFFPLEKAAKGRVTVPLWILAVGISIVVLIQMNQSGFFHKKDGLNLDLLLGTAVGSQNAFKSVNTVLVDAANIRRKPDLSAPVNMIVHKGDKLTVVKDYGDWALVARPERQEQPLGWIYKRLMSGAGSSQMKSRLAIPVAQGGITQKPVSTEADKLAVKTAPNSASASAVNPEILKIAPIAIDYSDGTIGEWVSLLPNPCFDDSEGGREPDMG